MEDVVGQKRARDEALDVVVVDETTSKKLCEGSGSSGLEGLPSEEQKTLEQEGGEVTVLDGPCASSSAELPQEEEVWLDGGAESKASLLETLRSLEEELGVSDQSAEYSIPSSDVEELENNALANWSHDIWSAPEFVNGSEDATLLAGGDLGCSSESSATVSGSLTSRDSSVLVDGDVCDTTTACIASSNNNNDRFDGVDIGFLCEASDDELGIPPSPISERELSCENEQAGQHSSLEAASTDSLHADVSWAMEGGGDNMGFSDSGIEEWMMGNLDFMMENPVDVYPGVSPLIDAGASPLTEVGIVL